MPMPIRRRVATALLGLAVAAATGNAAWAQKKYDTGASDTEIKIGNIVPYSGPASAYGVVGKAMAAVFRKVNDDGGINGRKIAFVSYDDAYSPPKAVEQARKLVESDEVLFLFGTLGTASNTAIQKYLNAKKVPQLFVATGATKWNDPKAFPWTMGWLPSYQSESRIYAKYLLKEKPAAKVAVLYQNDDMGKDYLKGLEDGFASDPARVVAKESYEVAEPTIDSHVVRLKSSNPDVIVFFTTPKFGAQAIKKLGEMNWKPVTIVSNVSASTATVMRPAGLDNAQGVISAAYAKDASDPQWKDDAGMKAFDELLAKYMPDTNRVDASAMTGYNMATTMVEVLRRCGDDLTRANVMKQAASLKQFAQGGLLPGVTLSTGPADFQPIEQLQLMQFKGERWQLFGDVISGEVGGH
ncbi:MULTISPECIES: ABC transporter substrate-binding protein [Bradyrhizobium]|uniref:Branched-chain amino acid ABC transporter substrate-binding protein n=1 Tax=Bradyrhizobium elkanii TaxID=29448 RepID=A0A4U6RWT0_BRAEL|nr:MULTISPECIES: ABC transporter substrate-binding protein [Bradyrhizobium]MTV16882.1 branched-chain amino acid ABC transporter substrate-binding protein [Bradyrhizobium sp. BR2003]TKV78673.1 branched-chain amino acid ABC transporter substrate-binding protein [Bradyrhizobium elkanii]